MKLSEVVAEVATALNMREFRGNIPAMSGSLESKQWLAARAGVATALREKGHSYSTIAALFGSRYHSLVINSLAPARLAAAKEHDAYWDAWKITARLLTSSQVQQEREAAAARTAVKRAKASAPSPEPEPEPRQPLRIMIRNGVPYVRADRNTLATLERQGLAGHSAAQRMERIGE